MGEPRRILVVAAESEVARALGAPLENGGWTVEHVSGLSELFVPLAKFAPQVVLLAPGPDAPLLMDLVRAIASATGAGPRPAISLLLPRWEPLTALRALWAGADDVGAMPVTGHTSARLGAVADRRSPPLVDRLLAVMQHARQTGTLRLDPGTPFEGRARFENGQLVSAEFGPLEGPAALEEMLWFENSVWRLEKDTAVPPAISRVPTEKIEAGFKPEILIVDDDPELRELLEAQLMRAGFQVRQAPDGRAGFEAALQDPPDVLLTDLDMPHLDGWGMLRRLQTHHRTREIPVVVYSGVEEAREALRAARAGAFDYVSKRWRSDRVVQRMVNLAMPLVTLRHALAENAETDLPPEAAGSGWVIRQLAELKLTGTLRLEDAFGRYALRLREGAPLDATASFGHRTFTDFGAVGALLSARPTVRRFTREPVEGKRTLTLSAEALLERTTRALDKLADAVLSEKLVDLHEFTVDDELWVLFKRFGAPRQVAIARTLIDDDVLPVELWTKRGVPREVVDEAVRELIRRGVIQLPRDSRDAGA